MCFAAKAHELRAFSHAFMFSSDVSIFTCHSDSFTGEVPLKEPVLNPVLIEYHFLPLGGSAGAGAFQNVYGDANFAIRSKVFDSLGGFSEDRGLSFEDWEFLSRAQLAGHEIAIIPEGLFWKRTLGDSMLRGNARHRTRNFMSEWRTLRPYFSFLPVGTGDQIGMARNPFMQVTDDGGPLVIAQSWDDWDVLQGTRGWWNGYRVRNSSLPEATLGVFHPFTESEPTTKEGFELFGPPPLPRWLHVAKGKQHGALLIDGRGAYVVVRQWLSDMSGRATVKLSVTRPDHALGCGDGSNISIVILGEHEHSTLATSPIIEDNFVQQQTKRVPPMLKEAVTKIDIDLRVGMALEFRQDTMTTADCDEIWLRGEVWLQSTSPRRNKRRADSA